MANAIYPKAKEQMLQGGINLSSSNVKIALFRSSAVSYNAADEFLDDVGTPVASTANLASKTFTNGVFDAANATATAVSAGAAIDVFVYYVDTGNAATSRVIAWKDTGHSPASITPNGGDITLTATGFTL